MQNHHESDAPVSRELGVTGKSNVVAADYQAGATVMANVRGSDAVPLGFRAGNDIINTQGETDHNSDKPTTSTRTPEQMKAVDFFSDAAKSFKGPDGKPLNEEQQNALYRTLMDRHCVDDYSASAKQDAETLKGAGVTEKDISAIMKKAADENIPGGRSCAVS